MFVCLCVLAAVSCVIGGSDGVENAYDFIVVGGGTSGLVAANRLSESPDVQVLIIESGYSALDDVNSSYPEFPGNSLTGAFDWNYQSAPQIYAYNRIEPLPGGKGIGGSSLINGMMYSRAESNQIDAWQEAGNEGWTWENLFPYYKKSQHLLVPTGRAAEAGVSYVPEFHGFSGPVNTGWPRKELVSDFLPTLNQSYAELGVPWNPDLAGGNTRGLGWYPWERTTGNDTFPDVRADAGRSYYYPYQDRPNLHMMSGTTALKILWGAESNGSAVANAVQVLTDSGETAIINATKEIVLACGTYRTPPLLEYSGVGNPRILSQYGIDTIIDLPGVGENLNDQIRNFMSFNTSANRTYNGTSSTVAWVTIADLLGSDPTTTITAFTSQIRSGLPSYAAAIAARNNNATDATTVLDLLSIQYGMLFDAGGIPAMELRSGVAGQTNLTVEFWGTMPFARGDVHITSPSPTDLPLANPRYWMFGYDVAVQIAAARFLRRLYLHTPPLSDRLVASEGYPGVGTVPEEAGDEDWEAWLKGHMRSAYHGIGSAAMLPRAKGGVVDARCGVHGTRNVRVVDASLIPFQTNGHTSSTVYAVAERCSDLIKEDWGVSV